MKNTSVVEKYSNKYNEPFIYTEAFFARHNIDLNSSIDEKGIDKKREDDDKNKPRPFVKWVGGKRQLIFQFKERGFYPPRDFNMYESTYFEPFVGGGAMFFDLRPKRAILSDLNEELVIAYKAIRDSLPSLCKKLKEHQENNSKQYYLKIRSQNVKRLSDVSKAARLIYLNRTCFNGIYRVNASGQFNVPYGRNINPMICDEVNLKKVHDCLQNIKILHQDYKKVLDEAKKGDFIYFDPPYYRVNQTSHFSSYTKEKFLEKEQKELSDVFLELHNRGCFVMLSNSDTKFINDLYFSLGNNIYIQKVSASRVVNSKRFKRGKISEVVVTNYKNNE